MNSCYFSLLIVLVGLFVTASAQLYPGGVISGTGVLPGTGVVSGNLGVGANPFPGVNTLGVGGVNSLQGLQPGVGLGGVAQQCGLNEIFQDCGTACQPTCTNKAITFCNQPCVRGCQCNLGFVRNALNQCVSALSC